MEETFYIDPRRYHGRPIRSTGPASCADPIDRTPQELACYDLLDSLGILYDRVDHSHADTIEACHAVEQVLASSQISELLNSDAFLEVTVAGSDDGQCGQILASMETATAHHANSHCGTATQEEVTEAHDAGLSFGKYRAFLEHLYF